MTNDAVATVRQAANNASLVASGEKLTLTGGVGEVYFETDQALGDTPTLTMDVTSSTGYPVHKFLLEEVTYYLVPTAVETYQLYLYEAATADDVEQLTDVAFWSPAAQASSTYYSYRSSGRQTAIGAAEAAQYKLPRVVELATAGKLYYALDWSGAPGVTYGFIKVKGRFLK